MTMVYDHDLLYLQKGVELYEKQKFGAAKKQFERLMKTGINEESEVYATAEYYVASCALELFHRDAEYLLKQFIQHHPASPRVTDAWFLLGNFNYRKKDWEDAIHYYRQISPADLNESDRSEYLFKLGYAYFQTNQKEEAANLFYQLKDPQSIYYAPGVYYLAHINYEKGNHASALSGFQSLADHPQFRDVVPYYIVQIYHFQEEYDKLIEYGKPFLNNTDVKRRDEISRLVGEALFKKERFEEAIPYLEDYMKGRSAKRKEDYYILGMAYFRSGNYRKAAETLSKITYTDDALAQNALYHMGEAYLKAGNKTYASNAYRAAANLNFDPAIAEDALYKHAQLSYELSYDPYDGAIAAFKEYIERYPNSERKQQALDYLVQIYLTSKNYDAALRSIEEYKDPDIRLKEAYQRIAFNRGVELFQEREYNKAISYFDKALVYDQNKEITALANYWKAEALYYQGRYTEAIDQYQKFIYSPGAALTPYFNLANYNIGYALFQQDKYIEAPQWFRRFTSVRSEKDESKVADANLRTGDCYFMLNQYDAAQTYYALAAKSGKSDPDYALYQLAMTYGLQGKREQKLAELQKLVDKYPQSSYLAAAYYEIGRTYIALNNNKLALEWLQKVVDQFKGSSYVRTALISIGQIHYNEGRDAEALSIFERIVKEYPNYEDAREALLGIERIYVDRGEPEKFEAYIDQLGFVDYSESSRDSLNYEAVENLYFNGQCKEAVEGFTKYLSRFEKALFTINARYYRGECLMKMGNIEEAMKDFAYVADQPQNRFTESALVQLARHAYSKGNCAEALAYYQRLSLLGEYKANLLEAEIGQMRCNFALKNYQGAIANALVALENEKLDPKIATEAKLIVARSNIMLKNHTEAIEYLEKVRQKGSPSQAAEATLLLAETHYNLDMMDTAEAIVFELVEKYKGEAKWVAKGLLLLSDIYMNRGDIFQAKVTLESIIQNYKPEDEVKTAARQKLATLQELENQPEDETDEDIEIYFDGTDSLKLPENTNQKTAPK
ncbi:MAG: tetratricopeptide repeat protein [Salibacteraceae bacterium]